MKQLIEELILAYGSGVLASQMVGEHGSRRKELKAYVWTTRAKQRKGDRNKEAVSSQILPPSHII